MRTLCWPLQMVQYFSQEQYSSALSHITQTTGPGMGASKKTVPEHGEARKASLRAVLSILTRFVKSPATSSFVDGQNSDCAARSLTRVESHASINFCLEHRWESANSPATSEMRKTPLNALHRRLGAKMVNFGGWTCPSSTHRQVVWSRSTKRCAAVWVFLTSATWGTFAFTPDTQRRRAGGRPAHQHERCFATRHWPSTLFRDAFIRRARLWIDVIVHRLGEDDFLLVINAGTREKDIDWVRQNTKEFDCVVEELSDAYTQLAIQGPRAAEVMQKLTDVKLAPIKNYWFTHGAVCGLKNVLIARTGYTGEDGFEIYVPSDQATSEQVWGKVMEAGREFGILPCGLGARNTLRLEAKMALYEHEISDKINVGSGIGSPL